MTFELFINVLYLPFVLNNIEEKFFRRAAKKNILAVRTMFACVKKVQHCQILLITQILHPSLNQPFFCHFEMTIKDYVKKINISTLLLQRKEKPYTKKKNRRPLCPFPNNTHIQTKKRIYETIFSIIEVISL